METTVETITLWDLLSAPSLTLHLPRFALFLIVVIMLEIFCSRKQVCVQCTGPMVMLLLMTGIGGIIAITLMVTAHIYVGTRAVMPFWYYPLTIAFVAGTTLAFLRGVKVLIRDRLFAVCIIRCLMFGITLYFAVATITTPIKVNATIEGWEKMGTLQKMEPAGITPQNTD